MTDTFYAIAIMARLKRNLSWNEYFYDSEGDCFCYGLYPESLFFDLEAARRVATRVRYTDLTNQDEFECDRSTLAIKEVTFRSVENIAVAEGEEGNHVRVGI